MYVLKLLYKFYIYGLLLIIITGCTHRETATTKPNILLIVIDDLRPELGCYGQNQVISPNIDALAEQSVVFENNYANVPVCMPSRISLLTGVHPMSNSFDIDFKRADLSYPLYKTFPELLKDNGYYTISNGKIFHTKEDSDTNCWSEPAWRPVMSTLDFIDEDSKQYQRYSSYEYFDKSDKKTKKVEGYRGPFIEFPDVPDNAYPDGKILEKSLEDLEKLSKKNQPFFLAVGFNKPHLPFYAPKKYWDLYHEDSIQIATNRYFPKNAPKQLKASEELKNLYHLKNLEYNSTVFHKEAIHGYYACISYVDKLVGDLINKLEYLELDDNTIVVLVGDHGFHLGEHNMWGKHNTLKNALSTPMLFKIPGKTKRKEKKITSLVDVYPTLCKLAKLKAPEHVQGENLFANKEENENVVFAKWYDQEVVITNQYLYVEWTEVNGKISEKMLFDHIVDPSENSNVAYKEAYKPVVERLSNLLKTKRESLKI